jgi:hypothetical protein
MASAMATEELWVTSGTNATVYGLRLGVRWVDGGDATASVVVHDPGPDAGADVSSVLGVGESMTAHGYAVTLAEVGEGRVRPAARFVVAAAP